MAGGVAQLVGRACTKERNVDIELSGGNCAAASAVGTEDDRLLHEAAGDGIGQNPTQTGGGNLGNNPGADMLNERRVNVGQGRCRQVQVLEPHLRQLIDNHIHNLVATAEMVVERYGHAVAQT